MKNEKQEKQDIRPVKETYFTRSDIASAVGVSEVTVKRWHEAGKMPAMGYEPVAVGSKVRYRATSNKTAFINPLDADSVRESSKNLGGEAPVRKFDPDTGKPVTRYEPHLTDNKGRRVAHDARTAATSGKDDDNPRFVSLSRTSLGPVPQ